MTRYALLLLFLLGSTTTIVRGQSSVLDDLVSALFGDDDDAAAGDDDFLSEMSDFLNEVANAVDGALAEALNFTNLTDALAEEIAGLLTLPNFENFTFEFGGNCSLCHDEFVHLEGEFENVKCDDWQLVANIGIDQGSDQCNMLRVAAAQSCGCPVLEEYKEKTCSICPDGEIPMGYRFNQTIGVTCEDLVTVPAVDGDQTCASVSKLASECNCQPGPLETSQDDENREAESSESASDSGRTQSTLSHFFLAAAVVLGVAL